MIKYRANAPLAQMVEQLTLNQWAQGSSPWRCTKENREQSVHGFLFAIFLFNTVKSVVATGS